MKLMGINASTNASTVTDSDSATLAAAQMGANVINLSWGGMGSCYIRTVINVIFNNYGAILVTSAGNGGEDGNTNFDDMSPSSCDNVLNVSAVDPGDNFSCWATAGPTVDLCAPGRKYSHRYS